MQMLDKKLAKSNKDYLKNMQEYSKNRDQINDIYKKIDDQFINETEIGKFCTSQINQPK